MFNKPVVLIKSLVMKSSGFLKRVFYAVLYFLLYMPCGGKAAFRKRSIDFTGLKAGDRVLDVCCGHGQMAGLILNSASGVELAGVDISAREIQKARENNCGKNATFVRASAADLPFEAQRFNKCIFSFGIHHLTQVERRSALSEIRRVLAEEGTLVIIDYNSPEKGIKRFIASIFARTDQSAEAYKMFKENSLPEELYQAGFEIKEKQEDCAGVILFVRAKISNMPVG